MKANKNMDVMTLRAIARSLDIEGWWEMQKEELLEAIEQAENSEDLDIEVDEPVIVVSEEVEEVEEVEEEKPKKRKNKKHMIEYKGETKSLKEWSQILGKGYQILLHRLMVKKMTPEEAFETPVRKMRYKNN